MRRKLGILSGVCGGKCVDCGGGGTVAVEAEGEAREGEGFEREKRWRRRKGRFVGAEQRGAVVYDSQRRHC